MTCPCPECSALGRDTHLAPPPVDHLIDHLPRPTRIVLLEPQPIWDRALDFPTPPPIDLPDDDGTWFHEYEPESLTVSATFVGCIASVIVAIPFLLGVIWRGLTARWRK